MGANRFDKGIKEKFEARRIQPSANAWSRIEGQLDAVPVKKSRPYVWLAVAAGIVGILFVSVPSTKWEEQRNLPVREVVERPKDGAGKVLHKGVSSSTMETNLPDSTEVAGIETRSVPEKIKKGAKKPSVIKDSEELVSAKEVVLGNGELEEVLDTEEIINAKVDELVVQVAQMEKGREALTNAEVDSLLDRARKEILGSKTIKSRSSVDAMALLADVETELDRSFRDQLFDALKERFLRVRTALADRNQ